MTTFAKIVTQHLAGCNKAMNVCVTDDQMHRITAYADLLDLWSRRINLTAIKKPQEVAEKHFADCLAAVSFLSTYHSIIDIGTGAGFPGIVIKIMCPDTDMVLVDASRKKVNFLKEVIRTLGLKKIQAIHQRIESLGDDPVYAGRFDAAVCRAYSSLSLFVEQAVPLLSKQGVCVAMKGPQVYEELKDDDLSGYEYTVHSYMLPFEKSDRTIVQLRLKA